MTEEVPEYGRSIEASSKALQREALERAYEFVMQRRDFEINQLVQRNNFFMIFQGVLLAGLAQASGSAALPPIVAFVICATGLGMSFFQLRMAAGAKFWQERWEQEVDNIEAKLFPNADQAELRFFHLIKKQPIDIVRDRLARPQERDKPFIKWIVSKKPSPSGIPIWTGLFFMIAWLVLLTFTIRLPFLDLGEFSWIVGFPK